jgi:hypothetical protein
VNWAGIEGRGLRCLEVKRKVDMFAGMGRDKHISLLKGLHGSSGL